jgi:CDP-glucose 4,6-dehydratase
MKFLITGHTGFKGSWMAALLKIQGNQVYGVSLNPSGHSHYEVANIKKYLNRDIRQDIRNSKSLIRTFRKIQPDVILHLAAQPLVRESYKNPLYTFETNVIGTLNVLNASLRIDHLKATLIITSDKVYKNNEDKKPFIETDSLGGEDPYSSSKAAADIAAQAWRSSYGKSPIAIARAGNVIGGGDYAADRIIPDMVKAIEKTENLIIRNPNSIRPWQHVLDCLNGYQKLLDMEIENKTEGEWNFGPENVDMQTVNDLVLQFQKSWGKELIIKVEPSNTKEVVNLSLNSDKSRNELNWKEKLSFEESIEWTTDWYKNPNSISATEKQIKKFMNL